MRTDQFLALWENTEDTRLLEDTTEQEVWSKVKEDPEAQAEECEFCLKKTGPHFDVI